MKYTVQDELNAQSDNNPYGPVRNEEDLLRVVYGPENIDEDGEVINTALTLSDLKNHDRGLSVDRYQYVSPEGINQRIKAQMKGHPKDRDYANIVKVKCSNIRDLVTTVNVNSDQEERAFLIIDDAVEGNNAHALVFIAIKCGQSKMRKLRDRLLQIMQDRYKFEELFPEA